MEFIKEDYELAKEYVAFQMGNSSGEDDLAYYVAMVWYADPSMKKEDLNAIEEEE
jgi:hypothetical protein